MAGILIDLVNQSLNTQALGPVVVAATTQGTVLDYSSADIADIGAIVGVGAVGANTTSVVVQIEECSTTNGTFTLIAGMITTITTTGTTAPVVMKGTRQQQYVRANAITATGTTVSVALQVCILQQLKFTGTGGGYSRAPSS